MGKLDKDSNMIHLYCDSCRLHVRVRRVTFKCFLTLLALVLGYTIGSMMNGNRVENECEAPPDGRKKMIILAYMRGGSSFVGGIFRNHPEIFYMFELMDAAYQTLYNTDKDWRPQDIYYNVSMTERDLPAYEQSYVTNLTLDLFNCESDKIPVQLYLHRYAVETRGSLISGYKQCLDGLNFRYEETEKCHNYVEKFCQKYFNQEPHPCYGDLSIERRKLNDFHISNSTVPGAVYHYKSCYVQLIRQFKLCFDIFDNTCMLRDTKILKSVRLSMKNIQHILKQDPTVKVLHLVRDPRAIIQSRRKVKLMYRKRLWKESQEAELLCPRMLSDIKIRKELEKIYPNNFLNICYEDLAANITKVTKQIYDFLGLEMTRKVEDDIRSFTEAKKDAGPYNIIRRNSQKTATKWRRMMRPQTKKAIRYICEDVLTELGYPLDIL